MTTKFSFLQVSEFIAKYVGEELPPCDMGKTYEQGLIRAAIIAEQTERGKLASEAIKKEIVKDKLRKENK